MSATLIIHGLGDDSRKARELISPGLPAGTRVLAPDIRAHGDSVVIGTPNDFSFESITAELTQAVRIAGFDDEPLTVIGISLGAALALHLAHAAQLPVTRLVLVRPAFTDESLPANLAIFPVIGALLHRHPADHAEHLFRGTGLYRSLRDASRMGAAGAIEQFRAPDAKARAIRLVELPRNRAFLPGDPAIAVPTTIIAAPRDPVHPLEVASAWHRRILGAELTVVPARDDGIHPYLSGIRAAVSSALHSPSPH